MDKIVESMTTRFVNNNPLYMDLSLLSPVNFDSFKQNGLSKRALETLSKNLVRFTNYNNMEELHQQLCKELISFANNWDNLKNSINDEYNVDNFDSEDESDEDENDDENIRSTTCNTCKNCVCCCLKLLVKYNLYSNAYENLYLAYNHIVHIYIV
jgi:hypothetical protein